MNKKESNLLLPLVIIILSITSFLISNYILMPNINKNLAKISAYNKDIDAANAKLDSISVAEKSITQLSSMVNDLLIAVPVGVNSPDLITEIEIIANQSAVALPNLSPPESINLDTASSLSPGLVTNLTAVGSFQNVNNFINSLEKSIRFSRINNLTMSANDSSVTATISFDVFSQSVNSSDEGVL
jgi:hypothetical protein